jgi:hypothetical protein
VIKLVLDTTPEDGMRYMPKHARKNILKNILMLKTICSELL